MVYNIGDLDLPVSNYGRKEDFSGANIMTSFPANTHRVYFKIPKQLSKQGLLKVVTGRRFRPNYIIWSRIIDGFDT